MTEANPLPHNLDAECAVLGAAMSGAKLNLQPEDFFLESHRRIWRKIQAQDHPDLITVVDALRQSDELEQVGGASYVAELLDVLKVSLSGAAYHARLVRSKARLRAFIRQAQAAVDRALTEQCAPETLICELSERLSKLAVSGPENAEQVLASGRKFISRSALNVEWLVDGVIQQDANGVICAEPKAGKSWMAADLAISLALGCSWMGRRVPRPVKTALISREDGPLLTSWRLRHLALGRESRGISADALDENLWVNSRAQTASFSLDDPEQMADMIRALKMRGIEFAIFDVLNVLHGADENDAQQMRAVMQKLSFIQSEAGCSIAVIHHLNKGESGSLMRRLRGSSAIAGWVEWLVGITVVDEDTKLRRMDFIGKAAASIDPIHYFIVNNDATGTCALELADASCIPHSSESTARHRPI